MGIYGDNGQGLCFEMNVHDRVDIILCPMGKALASHGAFALTNPVLRNFLITSARSFLYTTALPPVSISWNLFVINHMGKFENNRKSLFRTSEMFRKALLEHGILSPGRSHIIPVITGSNQKAVELSALLIENGFLAFPIRPPMVAENLSRIRFSLTSAIEYKDIDTIPGIINSCIKG